MVTFASTLTGWSNRREHGVCSGMVDRKRNVVERRKARQRFHVDIVRQRRQRILEEDQYIQLPLGDHRADLRVAAERAAEEPRDLEARAVDDAPAGGAGAPELVLGQRVAVLEGPGDELVLLVVMGNEADAGHGILRVRCGSFSPARGCALAPERNGLGHEDADIVDGQLVTRPERYPAHPLDLAVVLEQRAVEQPAVLENQ